MLSKKCALCIKFKNKWTCQLNSLLKVLLTWYISDYLAFKFKYRSISSNDKLAYVISLFELTKF